MSAFLEINGVALVVSISYPDALLTNLPSVAAKVSNIVILALMLMGKNRFLIL